MKWNAELYQNKHGYVAEYGREFINHALKLVVRLQGGQGAVRQDRLGRRGTRGAAGRTCRKKGKPSELATRRYHEIIANRRF